ALGSVATPAPTPGTAWNPVIPVAFVYVWRRKGCWVWADLRDPDPAPVHPVDLPNLSDMVLPRSTDPDDSECRTMLPGAVLVLPDRATARALAAAASAAGVHALARLIRVAGSLTSSSRVVVLTESLARKAWFPVGVDEANLTALSYAVGVGARTSLSAIRRLLLVCHRPVRRGATALDISDGDLE
ncbi:hypothetical protein U6M47_12860, partial [Cutibacterium acnes]